MTKRNLIAALLGAIAMFAWTSVAHMALPLGEAGVREVPHEEALLAAMQTALGEAHGFYIFPGMGTPPITMLAYETKLAATPSGVLIYHPPGGQALTVGKLGTEFATELAECLLVVFLLAQTTLISFSARVGFVTVAGVLAAIATNVPYLNWYGFPPVYTAAAILTEIVAFLCAGLAIAAVTKSR